MNSRIIFALILIFLGAGFLFDSFNVIEFGDTISTWWPLLIIALGVAHISKKNPPIFTGLIIITVGLLLQADKLDFVDFNFWDAFWPIVLIIIGISVLLPGKQIWKQKQHFNNVGELELNTIFGAQNKSIQDNNFKGGNISVVFGGIELDLTDSHLSENNAYMNINTIFGAVELSVPQDWNVKITGTPIFGGFEDKTVQEIGSDNEKTLYVNYVAVFGGVELNNRPKKH